MLALLLVPAALSGVFTECERLYAEDPAGRAGPRCFYQTAVKSGELAAALPRVEALRAANPDNHWLDLYLATLYHHHGDERAVDAYRAAADGFAAIGEAEGEVNARGNQAVFLRILGRLDEAGVQVELALAAAERAGNAKALRLAKGHLAKHLYVTSGDLARAERLYLEVEREIFPTGDYPEQVSCLLTLAGIARETGRLEDAHAYMRRAYLVSIAAGDRFSAAFTRYRAARLRVELVREADDDSQRGELVAELEAALADARRAQNRFAEAEVHALLGELVPDGVPHFEACLTLEGVHPDLPVASGCRWGIARAIAASDPVRALALLEQSRAQGIDAPYAALYQIQLAKLHGLAGRHDEAIAAWERSLDALDGLADAQPDEAMRRGVTARWSAYYYDYAGWLLAGDAIAPALRAVERVRARDLSRHLAAARLPAGAPLAPVDLAGVAATLADDEALLSYQLAPRDDAGGGGSWLVVVTRADAFAARLPARGRVEPAVRLFTGLVERRDGSERAAAQRLYADLLAAAVARLPARVTHLVVVPDGALHRLPFAALRDAEGRAVAERYRLTVAPSATLWAWWRRGREAAPPRAGGPVLVLADPAGPDALPAARREAAAIVELLGGGRLLAGAEASRGALAGAGPGGYRVVHFATHAVVDEGVPHRSAVLLADGRLEMAAIAALPLGGRMVVLAACRSAGGTDVRGEGVLGLAHAFFRAGAPVVVGSLWSLRDDEAAWLFTAFYERLAAGASAAEALRAAQAELARGGAPAAAWAGVVVLGDGEVAPFPRRARRGWGWAVLVGLAAAAALAIAVRGIVRSIR